MTTVLTLVENKHPHYFGDPSRAVTRSRLRAAHGMARDLLLAATDVPKILVIRYRSTRSPKL